MYDFCSTQYARPLTSKGHASSFFEVLLLTYVLLLCVISILHRDLKINAGFKKNGAYGSLSWQGKHPKRMKLNDVSTLNPMIVGDTIVTGGMSDYFPYGILIGKVFSFQKPELEGYYNIDIELFSNLTQKDFVYILKNIYKM